MDISFVKRDAGPIKDWWKERIHRLIDADDQLAARALYKEFYLSPEYDFPERY